MIMGIYEKILEALTEFFKDIKNNIKFLLPLFLGSFIGVITCSNALSELLYRYPVQINSIFIGLILGGIPFLLKEIKSKSKVKKTDYIFLITSLIVGLLLNYIEEYSGKYIISDSNSIYIIICGFIAALGYVLPGVSSTIILMTFGIYPIYLSAISSVNITFLTPYILGVLLGLCCWVKITKTLFSKHYVKISYIIIGFTIGSVFVLIPNIDSLKNLMVSIFSIILGVQIIKILTPK